MKTQHALYYNKFCFFCQKVLMFLRGQSHDIELRSTSDAEHKAALVTGGGKTQVPCLRIQDKDGQIQWMYESDDIINYLKTA